MKLWHFTGERHVAGIRKYGIRRYADQAAPSVPQHLYVWLTDDPDWTRQTWATQVDHDCDRTAYRVRVHVDEGDERLARFHDARWRFPAALGDPGLWGDAPRHWWLYAGVVPASAIRVVERRP